jgi:hypothetical protein
MLQYATLEEAWNRSSELTRPSGAIVAPPVTLPGSAPHDRFAALSEAGAPLAPAAAETEAPREESHPVETEPLNAPLVPGPLHADRDRAGYDLALYGMSGAVLVLLLEQLVQLGGVLAQRR